MFKILSIVLALMMGGPPAFAGTVLQTRFGTLEFKGGYAAEKTSLKLREKLDESFVLTG